jgi:tRNA(adenine34) deaminase
LATDDQRWMERALAEARAAAARGEVPVGAVVVREGRLLAAAGNASIATADPTAHAEVCAIREAGRLAGNYRLPGAELYVTLEPCAMCVGAALTARLARIVFACHDPKAGAAGSVVDLTCVAGLNHRLVCTPGVGAAEAAALLQDFFRARRAAR